MTAGTLKHLTTCTDTKTVEFPGGAVAPASRLLTMKRKKMLVMARRKSDAKPRPARGVYELDPDADGNRVFIALATDGEPVGYELVPPDQDTKPAITSLWDQLHATNPVKPGGGAFPAIRLQ